MLGVVNIDRRAETAPFDLNRVNLQRLLPQFHLPKQACRKLGAGEACATQFLADKLTLSQPWEAHYAHHITTCPPPPLCFEWGFTQTFPRNQDASVKSKAELISSKFK